MNVEVLKRVFPQKNIRFAMFGDYVNRYKRRLNSENKPKLDLIIAVDDLKEFHTENI